MPPVVAPSWVEAQLKAGAPVVLCDVRWYLDGRSGRAAYEDEHIAGAVFVDLDACLAAAPSVEGGRHPLPDPAVFASCLGAAGIGEGDTVVAYDDQGGLVAARLVWLLRVTGRPAALLDGGLASWPGPRRSSVEHRPAASLAVVPWPGGRLAAAPDLAAPGPATVVLDARAPERYRGEVEPIDPRAGHVPGAVNLPAAGNLAATLTFLPPEELRARFEAAGVRAGADVVAYCGSGVNACHTLLALEHARMGDGRLYAGSWSQWSADDERPVATGSDP